MEFYHISSALNTLIRIKVCQSEGGTRGMYKALYHGSGNVEDIGSGVKGHRSGGHRRL